MRKGEKLSYGKPLHNFYPCSGVDTEIDLRWGSFSFSLGGLLRK